MRDWYLLPGHDLALEVGRQTLGLEVGLAVEVFGLDVALAFFEVRGAEDDKVGREELVLFDEKKVAD